MVSARAKMPTIKLSSKNERAMQYFLIIIPFQAPIRNCGSQLEELWFGFGTIVFKATDAKSNVRWQQRAHHKRARFTEATVSSPKLPF